MHSASYLIVIDEDRGEFAVEGPMFDDRPWNRAVVRAQNEGRRVRCCNGGSVSRADAIEVWQHTYNHRLVESGAIVWPSRP
jgi:hypothetical protein